MRWRCSTGAEAIALKALVNGQVSAGVVSARLDWNKLSAGGAKCECADLARR